MSATLEYLTLLAISIGLTIAVGRVLLRAGEPFLQDVFQDRAVTRSVNRLLSVLFHLITLGVLTIISAVDFRIVDTVQRILVKLGVVLIILGVAYGVSMLTLIKIRERRRASQISEQVQERLSEQGGGGPPITSRPADGPPATTQSMPPAPR